jgi:hypothetical protein
VRPADGRPGAAEDDDCRADELVSLAAEVMDPTHGRPVSPPRLSAAELIALAKQAATGPD